VTLTTHRTDTRPRTRSATRRVLSGGLVALMALTSTNRPRAQVPAPAPDELFKDPYVDVDEWRDAPVRHRYVHGGFKGTETRFSIYLPPKDQYQGRFFQHITPVPDDEHLAQKVAPGEYNKIGFAIASGAYFLETNGGGHLDLGKAAAARPDPTITAYRANAASAQYSRVVAIQMYGGKRPFGYAYGGSGGAYRTVGSFENTIGVWDGVVPYVLGSTMAIPNMFTVRIRAMRILKDKFPQILDAVEPGGSGDPYAGLTDEEAGALREVTRMGFPMPSWFGYKTMGIHGFAALHLPRDVDRRTWREDRERGSGTRLRPAGHVLPGPAWHLAAPGRPRHALRAHPEPRPRPGGREVAALERVPDAAASVSVGVPQATTIPNAQPTFYANITIVGDWR
jgi:hypothetical protein